MSSITHQYHLAAPSYIQGPNIPPWTPYFATATTTRCLLATDHGTSRDHQREPGRRLAQQRATTARPSARRQPASRRTSGRGHQVVRPRAAHPSPHLRGRRDVRRPHADDVVVRCRWCHHQEDRGPLRASARKFRNLIAEVGDVHRAASTYRSSSRWVPCIRTSTTWRTHTYARASTSLSRTQRCWRTTPVNRHVRQRQSAVESRDTGWGAGLGNFLSWGAFPQPNGYLGMTRGLDWQRLRSRRSIVASDVPAKLTGVHHATAATSRAPGRLR